MKRFVVVVLDGFGLGAMEDACLVRPGDAQANTCARILAQVPGLRLPMLEQLGLGNAFAAAGGSLESLPAGTLDRNPEACYGVCRLGHVGADTFWGHQELMGTRPLAPRRAPFSESMPVVREALLQAGHQVRLFTGADSSRPPCGVLVVDEAVTVGDNLETEPGVNYNVTACLDRLPFSEVTAIGQIVRAHVHSSRVIVFGGSGVVLGDLLAAFEASEGGFAGVSAPRSGVYRENYHVLHMGYGVDPSTQVPNRLDALGIPTVLIGKVADIVENPNGQRIPCVDTDAVLRLTLEALDGMDRGFICANVQETDLAGHQQDPGLYAHRLEQADRGLRNLVRAMAPDDLLVVTADHGNDPGIGHAQHTRERTPILVHGARARPGFIGERATLADTGATVADAFGAAAPQSGTSYLEAVLASKEGAR